MKKTFAKFEFTPTEWATLQKDIQQTTTTPSGEVTTWKDCAVVEIGFICLEWGTEDDKPFCTKQSDKWAVDILFYSEPPASFAPFEVFPKPCGVHTFSGDDSLYLKTFCAKYPDSPYCIVPEPLTTIE
jgi:hypothetical protein